MMTIPAHMTTTTRLSILTPMLLIKTRGIHILMTTITRLNMLMKMRLLTIKMILILMTMITTTTMDTVTDVLVG